MDNLIYITAGGIALGVVGFLIWKNNNSKNDPESKNVSELEQIDNPGIDVDSNFIIIDELTYEMLLKWLREQAKQNIAEPGNQFVIMQHPVAKQIFLEAYPNQQFNCKDCSLLCTAIMKNNEVLSSHFFCYKVLADSLKDILPEDENKAYVQNLN